MNLQKRTPYSLNTSIVSSQPTLLELEVVEEMVASARRLRCS
jgi:hypothetical protein